MPQEVVLQTLCLSYVIQGGDNDADGIVATSPIDLNGGFIGDDAVNAANVTFSPPAMGSVLVDTSVPVISGVSVPVNGLYQLAENLTFVVTFNETVNVTGTPQIELTFESGTQYADYLDGTGSATLTFEYGISKWRQ